MGTLESVLARVNYSTGLQREDACQACVHVDRQSPFPSNRYPKYQCKLHGFITSPMAICDDLAINSEWRK